MQRRVKVFFDGGCRPNPGTIEIAAVARGVAHVVRNAGQGTSGDAEWLALRHALGVAQGLGAPFVLLGDSAAVVAVASGRARARGAALAHWQAFLAQAGDVPPPVRHIRRAQNLAGIALAAGHPR